MSAHELLPHRGMRRGMRRTARRCCPPLLPAAAARRCCPPLLPTAIGPAQARAAAVGGALRPPCASAVCAAVCTVYTHLPTACAAGDDRELSELTHQSRADVTPPGLYLACIRSASELWSCGVCN